MDTQIVSEHRAQFLESAYMILESRIDGSCELHQVSDGRSVRDYFLFSLDAAKDFALNAFGVPMEAWGAPQPRALQGLWKA